MVRKTVICLLVCLFIVSTISFADEGMWVLDALNELPWKKIQAKGLELNPKDIYNPKGVSIADAVVQIGGGTGTFVSSKGLILTNHHVAFGAIQRQSSADQDLLRKGFLASTIAEEIHAKGYQARICTGMKDVTKKVLKGINDNLSYAERYEIIQKNQQKIVDAAETEDYIRANVLEMLSGTKYYLFTYYVIKDVRIVYAPSQSVGEYGGDIDNWMWPRHTGDFSFMRAYVGPDGKPADYSETNVPFKPKNI